MKSPDRALVARIRSQIDDRRSMHPEIAAPVTFGALRAILARERIELIIRPHPRLAELIPIVGRWTIIVDHATTSEERLALVAHELGHLWLHHDPFFPRHETHVYDSGCPWYDEQRELEANVFAELLVGQGPEILGKRGHVASLLPGSRRAAHDAVTLTGVVTISAEAIAEQAARALEVEKQSKREKREHRVVHRRSKNAASNIFTGQQFSDRRSADDEQLKFLDEARGAARFTDDNGTRWWIYDYDEHERRVRDFMSRSITHRMFVNAAGVTKVYDFRDRRELRELAVKHLERQLREARER